ncbi:MAG TPA: amidase family protein, partial [Terriglobales bacterium]|nr:amidase family protein [Terriglobales bacterium]
MSPTRREFVKNSALAGAAAAAIASAPATFAAPAATELDELTVAELAAGLVAGRFTCRGLAQHYLDRIAGLDKSGPGLNSVIELNPDAPAIADALDSELKAKGRRGPLHGVPLLIKDNIATRDRMQTTAGSLALVGSVPPRDAFIVQQLRKAGAVILGKTNLSEWANIRSAHSTSGWSGRGGLTRHPYALDRNPSGSSSGSAVAASSNLCAVAVGTETDGSVISPSAMCGLVGIKPTVGLVSRSGIVPIAHSQDTAGPMCRSVGDAAALLSAMAGLDAADVATAAQRRAPDYTKFLDENGLRGARLGVVRKYFGFNDAVDRIAEAALAAMKRAGAEIIDPADIPTIGKWDETELLVLLYELKADLNKYLAELGPGAPVKSLKDIIEFNNQHAAEEMPYFGQD